MPIVTAFIVEVKINEWCLQITVIYRLNLITVTRPCILLPLRSIIFPIKDHSFVQNTWLTIWNIYHYTQAASVQGTNYHA